MSSGIGFSGLSLIVLLQAGTIAAQSSPPVDDFESKLKPLFGKYCYKCHGPQLKPKADLNMLKFQSAQALRENRKVSKEILVKIHTREMPPPEFSPQPEPAEREAMAKWIDDAINKLDATGPRLAGRVVWRRLNRVEYRNTVRDLLGVDFDPRDFPTDDVGYGFDNIGDVLSIPPLLVEKYVAAAKKIADLAVAGPKKDALIFTVKPDPAKPKREAAKATFQTLLLRAFRRPPTPEDLERWTKLYEQGEKFDATFEGAMKLPLRAILISPHFLFRIENESAIGDATGAYPISDWEFASRLSYFLWSSMPDDELLEHAKKGALRNPKVLEPQIARMIKDPRSRELAENFATQWLQIRRLEEVKFDAKQFPGFNDGLRQDMIQEAVLFFEAILKEDRGALELLDTDFTFLNGRLAQHYGLSASGQDFQRVKLGDGRRGGVLTMAAVLAATSDPDRTSPVKRGKWVLESILGSPPPPPVPDAANLKPEPGDAGLTLRQKMERHRKDPNCASCHNRMDPIGFGLENYDAIGAWRDRDGGKPIDASAALPDGSKFNGPLELKKVIQARKEQFVECLVEKMLTFGLGRGVEHYDGPVIKDLTTAMAKNGYKLSTLVVEVVKSYPFQYRQKDKVRR
ncbi:MAG TPA: DUF1592 domain-containing protein [Planctomycetota bacterium]